MASKVRKSVAKNKELVAHLDAVIKDAKKALQVATAQIAAAAKAAAKASADDAADEDDGDESLRTLEFSNLKADVIEINYDGDDDQVVFDPVRGMLRQDYIVTSPIEIQLSSAQGEYALNVTMLPTGRVSMCSDGDRASKLVPGYNVCG